MRAGKTGRIDALGTMAALAALLSWSSGPLFIRYLRDYMDAWSQNLWRYSVALVFWLPYVLFALMRGRVHRRVWRVAIVPAIANVAMQSLWALSLYYLEPGFAALLARSSVIWAAVFSMAWFPDERGLLRSKRFWFGMVLCLPGIAGVIVAGEGFTATTHLTGIFLMLAAAALWSFYTVSARSAFAGTDSIVGFSVVCLYTVAGLAVIALIWGKPSDAFRMPAQPWVCVVFSAIVCMALGHTFYYSSMRRIGAMIPTLILSLLPFVTLVWSMIVFHERLNRWQWASGAVLVISSAMAASAQAHIRRGDRT